MRSKRKTCLRTEAPAVFLPGTLSLFHAPIEGPGFTLLLFVASHEGALAEGQDAADCQVYQRSFYKETSVQKLRPGREPAVLVYTWKYFLDSSYVEDQTRTSLEHEGMLSESAIENWC